MSTPQALSIIMKKADNLCSTNKKRKWDEFQRGIIETPDCKQFKQRAKRFKFNKIMKSLNEIQEHLIIEPKGKIT